MKKVKRKKYLVKYTVLAEKAMFAKSDLDAINKSKKLLSKVGGFQVCNIISCSGKYYFKEW